MIVKDPNVESRTIPNDASPNSAMRRCCYLLERGLLTATDVIFLCCVHGASYDTACLIAGIPTLQAAEEYINAVFPPTEGTKRTCYFKAPIPSKKTARQVLNDHFVKRTQAEAEAAALAEAERTAGPEQGVSIPYTISSVTGHDLAGRLLANSNAKRTQPQPCIAKAADIVFPNRFCIAKVVD